MSHLKTYIDRHNSMVNLLGGVAIDYPVPAKDVEDVRSMIECELSPENLTCDGEATRAYVEAESALLNGAYAELEDQ